MRSPTRRVIALSVAASMALAPIVQAGDLNSEINSMFNDLGGVGNYTAPGAFRGQTMNTYSGGSLMLRIPNKRYQFVAAELPSITAGCNGVNINGGSFSMMNKDEFVDMLKKFGASMKAVAFQLALKSVSPLFAGVTEYFKDLESKFSISSKSSCELATMAAGKLGDLTGYSTDRACTDIALAIGKADSYEEAEQLCKVQRKEIVDEGRASSDPAVSRLPPFSGNLTWRVLAQANNGYLDDDDRELIMSMVGTVIYDADGQVQASLQPTITTPAQLLYGEADDAASDGGRNITVLRCKDRSMPDASAPGDPSPGSGTSSSPKCDEVDVKKIPFRPLSKKVQDLMVSIVAHIRDKQAFDQPSEEVAFVNMVNEPVYRMLAVATSSRDNSQAYSLIGRYGDVIAADFAIGLLSRTLRVGAHSLTMMNQLSPAQVADANSLQRAADTMLTVLAQEKTTLYTKVAGVESMTRELERLQTTLRTNSAAKVLTLFGERTSYRN